MKFTAEFDSVNSADIAASAIRKNISSFSHICVHENRPFKNPSTSNRFLLFGIYNGSQVSTPPIYTSGVIHENYDELNEAYMSSKAILEVICRKEEEKNVSQQIIGHGGINIRTVY